MGRPPPVRREQGRWSLTQTEAPEPGEKTGTRIIGAPILNGLAAPVAAEVLGLWIGLVGGLAAIEHFALETEHEALPVAGRIEWLA